MKKLLLAFLIASFVMMPVSSYGAMTSSNTELPNLDVVGDATVGGTLVVTGETTVEGDRVVGKRVFSIPVTNPDNAVDQLVWRAPWDITITAVNGVCMDGTNLTCQINECDADGDNAAQITNDTAVTVGNTALTITNATVDALDYISFTSSAETGDVTKMMLSVEFTID